MTEGRVIPYQRQPWKPGLCSDCHRPPKKERNEARGYLRRGLCMACYQYRRRKGLAMPPMKERAGIVYRKKRGEGAKVTGFSPWDRFR